MRCDWYAATIKDSENNLIQTLRDNFVDNVRHGAGKMGYEKSFQFLDNDGVVLTVFSGGNNGAMPHAIASSDRADKFREFCQIVYQDSHEVTRIDVCQDFDNGFERMAKKLVNLADRKNLFIDQRGDWLRQDSRQGKTLYLGSPTSAVRARLYEKGKQLAQEHFYNRNISPPIGFPLELTRLEIQVRPVKYQRKEAAKADLVNIWGYSKWSKELAEEVLNVEPTRCSADAFRVSDSDRALEFMLKQYGKILGEKLKQFDGDWAMLGLELERIHKFMKACKKQ